MRCEVCGEEIRGQPHRRIIEGGRLTVCGRCANFGSADWNPAMPRQPPRGRPAPRRPRSEVEATETMELVEDYGAMIRRARQKKRMTVEDFARKIQEKESVVKKLEKENAELGNQLSDQFNKFVNEQCKVRNLEQKLAEIKKLVTFEKAHLDIDKKAGYRINPKHAKLVEKLEGLLEETKAYCPTCDSKLKWFEDDAYCEKCDDAFNENQVVWK